MKLPGRLLGALLVLASGPLGAQTNHPPDELPVASRSIGLDLARPQVPTPPLQRESDEIPDWQAWLELARLQSYTEKYDEALDSYARVLELEPDNLSARLERAKVLMWAGRADDAWRALEDVPPAELDVDSKLLLADLYAAREDYAAAERLYQSHLQANPDDDGVRLKLAEVLSWDKRYPASLEQYQRLLKRNPKDVQLRRKYAFVLSWAGRPEEAARELKRTLP
jgi:tetratricopeptide (TPR) repeat protein